jgi:hypothetical protein
MIMTTAPTVQKQPTIKQDPVLDTKPFSSFQRTADEFQDTKDSEFVLPQIKDDITETKTVVVPVLAKTKRLQQVQIVVHRTAATTAVEIAGIRKSCGKLVPLCTTKFKFKKDNGDFVLNGHHLCITGAGWNKLAPWLRRHKPIKTAKVSKALATLGIRDSTVLNPNKLGRRSRRSIRNPSTKYCP